MGLNIWPSMLPRLPGRSLTPLSVRSKTSPDFLFSAQKTEKQGGRRKYVRRFHYCIFYATEDDEVVVLHIRHAAQRLPWEKNNGVKPG
jgi:hypothetical protein